MSWLIVGIGQFSRGRESRAHLGQPRGRGGGALYLRASLCQERWRDPRRPVRPLDRCPLAHRRDARGRSRGARRRCAATSRSRSVAAGNAFAVGAVIRVAHSFLAREVFVVGRRRLVREGVDGHAQVRDGSCGCPTSAALRASALRDGPLWVVEKDYARRRVTAVEEFPPGRRLRLRQRTLRNPRRSRRRGGRGHRDPDLRGESLAAGGRGGRHRDARVGAAAVRGRDGGVEGRDAGGSAHSGHIGHQHGEDLAGARQGAPFGARRPGGAQEEARPYFAPWKAGRGPRSRRGGHAERGVSEGDERQRVRAFFADAARCGDQAHSAVEDLLQSRR